MRCPRCDAKSLFEEYAYDEEKKKYVRKIYCPVCYHREVFDITGDEPLEDVVEFNLQRYLKHVKEDIIECFDSGKIYHTGTTIEYKGKRVKVDMTIREKE